ncbi:MAG TPA: alpha/beta hydrolase [Chloroflexota bacterium]|nr:alpha/beta hydrolase [Chloroflexota bacterium]
MDWIRATVAMAMLVGSGAGALRPAAGTQPATPRFERTACHFKLGAGIVAGTGVRCGFVVVPEDRAVPQGRTIRLAVAIFPSPHPHPAPDPFVFLQGGPGGALISYLAPQITKKNRATDYPADRALILLDQRGTGLSQPSLACKETTALDYRTLNQQLSPQREADLQVQATRQCRTRLVASGINLNAYTTLANAADVADLRVALGYPALNLYAVSYGTRVALTVMRTHPQGIRSVILDSVEPPGVNAITSPLASTTRAFAVLFNSCTADAACAAAFPNLQQTFYRVVQRLNAQPVPIRTTDPLGKTYTVLLTGDRMIDLLFSALYVTPVIPALPAMIALADRGNFRIPSILYGPLELIDASINQGVFYSVECSEDAPFTTAQQVRVDARVLDPVIRPDIQESQLGELQTCQGWHVRPVPPAQRRPVTSAIPTLILSGQYDPITPPAHSLQATRTLRHSYRFVFPGTGHGVYLTGPCPNHIVAAFEDDPAHQPDARCIAAMTGPHFLVPRQR